ncbi:hypothetical protein GYH30_005573 [Glycine max]|nr:hypothetical protein GYH30_005573 [Glycine max]
MGSGGGKREFTVVRNFLAAKEKHLQRPECFSFLSTDEGLSIETGEKISLKRKAENNYNPSKRVKSKEGASSWRDEDYLQKRIDELDGLPREFQEKIQELNGCEVKFVTQKKLFKTDLNPQHARLSIPPAKIANRFLTPTEESSLNERRGKHKRLSGMPVMVLDPSLREYNMCFKKWEMTKSYVYNLTMGWNQIVGDNHLKLGDTLHLWSFRLSSQLCFALVKGS